MIIIITGTKHEKTTFQHMEIRRIGKLKWKQLALQQVKNSYETSNTVNTCKNCT